MQTPLVSVRGLVAALAAAVAARPAAAQVDLENPYGSSVHAAGVGEDYDKEFMSAVAEQNGGGSLTRGAGL